MTKKNLNPQQFEQVDATEACQECKGRCCRSLPGALLPQDLKDITVGGLTNLFRTGNYSVDWWEGFIIEGREERGYFIRPRTIGGSLVDPSWGGKCIFLTDEGCKLPFEERPWNCRALIPRQSDKGKECNFTSDINPKLFAAEHWAEYIDIIDEALSAVKD